MISKFSKGSFIKRVVSTSSLSVALGFAGSIFVAATPTPAMACGSESYIGTVCAVSYEWCPVGWLPADGRIMAVSNYQALYSLIGTRFGGSQASGAFNLPDLRGRGIVNYGAIQGLPIQPFAAQTGTGTATLSYGNLPPHTHSATFVGEGQATKSVNIPATPGTLGVTAKLSAKDEIGTAVLNANSYLGKGPGSGGGAASIYVPSTSTSASVSLSGLDVQLTGTAGAPPISFTYQTGITGGTVAIGSAGSGQPFSTQSPSLAMNYCIVVNGLYPERP